MIRSIARIGEILLNDKLEGENIAEKFVKGLIVRDNNALKIRGKKTAKPYMLIVVYDLDNGRVELDCKEVTDETFSEFVFIGNPSGSVKKDRFTLAIYRNKNMLGYLFSEVIGDFLSLTKSILSKKELISSERIKKNLYELKKLVERIDNEFMDNHYLKKGVKIEVNPYCPGKKKKNEIIFLGIPSNIKKPSKKAEFIVNELSNLIDLKYYTMATIAVKTNGEYKYIAKHFGYTWYIYYRKLYFGNKGEYKALHGKCHVCGQEKIVIINPPFEGGSLLKIYNLDKKHAFPKLPKDPTKEKYKKFFAKSFSICVDCLIKLQIGMRYIENTLTIRDTPWRKTLGDAILVPSFPTIRNFSKLELAIDALKNDFLAIASFEFVNRMAHILKRIRKDLHYTLTIIFGKREQQSFSLRGVITDVPKSTILNLVNRSAEFYENFRKYGVWRDKGPVLNFATIYSIFPLRAGKDRPYEWKELVELFKAILGESTYSYENILKRALLYAKIRRYGLFDLYNIVDAGEYNIIELMKGILLFDILIKFMDIQRSKSVLRMNDDIYSSIKEIYGENVESWLRNLDYNKQQTSLFLLGCVISGITKHQIRQAASQSPNQVFSIPILEKINFEGLTKEKVMSLVNLVHKYITIYKIAKYYLKKLALATKIISSEIGNWTLSPIENVFYILSGLSFCYLSKGTSDKGGEQDDK